MYKYFASLALGLAALLLAVSPTQAFAPGMHVLQPEEFKRVVQEFAPYRREDQPIYITIPFTLNDVDQLARWQKAFDLARDNNVIPLVRLATRFNPEIDAWDIPTRQDIVIQAKALDLLRWPQNKRHIIVFNEVNHAKEWGGRIDPHEFAALTDFTLDWFSTEESDYLLLPAALDLAAPDGPETKEAFGYWREVLGSKPEILDKIHAWNSHSYPNPAFSAPPSRIGKNSLRGFEHELAFLKNYSDQQWPVFITETGWDVTPRIESSMRQYYLSAAKNIWSHEQVVAVTPFLMAGSPGPFAGFSHFDEQGEPTTQWKALTNALRKLNEQLISLNNDRQ